MKALEEETPIAKWYSKVQFYTILDLTYKKLKITVMLITKQSSEHFLVL